MLSVTPGCSVQGQFPPQSFPAKSQRMFYSFSETSARKCRWHDSVWSAARRGGPHSKKDVKLYETNPRSPLASIKVLKKRTQTNSKRTRKTC